MTQVMMLNCNFKLFAVSASHIPPYAINIFDKICFCTIYEIMNMGRLYEDCLNLILNFIYRFSFYILLDASLCFTDFAMQLGIGLRSNYLMIKKKCKEKENGYSALIRINAVANFELRFAGFKPAS